MTLAALQAELAVWNVILTLSDTGGLNYNAPVPIPQSLVESMKTHRAELLAQLWRPSIKPASAGDVVPCLPFPLAAMVAAAASDQIPGGAKLSSGQVTDLGGYVLAWTAAYLTGDRVHALARLTEAWEAWVQSRHTS